MNYTSHLYNTKTSTVFIPVFSSENGDKKEEDNIRRMNGFYDELKRSIFSYTQSPDFPEGGRYFAKAEVTENKESLEIKMILRLRSKGKTVSTRILTHTWKDGVVTAKRIE